MHNTSTSTAGSEGGFGALRYALSFMLGNGGKYADGERIELGHVEGTYRNARVFKLKAKLYIAGEAVKFSHNQRAPSLATVSHRGGKHRAGAFLTRLDLNKFFAIETSVRDSKALTIKTEPRLALLARADS
jgi:hypothetical protein